MANGSMEGREPWEGSRAQGPSRSWRGTEVGVEGDFSWSPYTQAPHAQA